MALLTLQDIHLSYGSPPLLDGLNVSVEPGERICLIGRNGAGKSTLMKIIADELKPDEGQRVTMDGLKVARLQQEVPPDETAGRVFDLVASGVGELSSLIKDYHAAVVSVTDDPTDKAMDKLAHAQHALEAADGWKIEQRVERV